MAQARAEAPLPNLANLTQLLCGPSALRGSEHSAGCFTLHMITSLRAIVLHNIWSFTTRMNSHHQTISSSAWTAELHDAQVLLWLWQPCARTGQQERGESSAPARRECGNRGTMNLFSFLPTMKQATPQISFSQCLCGCDMAVLGGTRDGGGAACKRGDCSKAVLDVSGKIKIRTCSYKAKVASLRLRGDRLYGSTGSTAGFLDGNTRWGT